jgi:ribose 5-phosphate isomerase B
MRIAIGADHAGFPLKEALKPVLDAAGVAYVDFGTLSSVPVDYPDIAAAVACAVAARRFDCGVLVCGTGIGMAIAANKIAGIRAAPADRPDLARMARWHNDANVLTLGARVTSPDEAAVIVRTFLDTPFEGGRHRLRLDKIAALERPPDEGGAQGTPCRQIQGQPGSQG